MVWIRFRHGRANASRTSCRRLKCRAFSAVIGLSVLSAAGSAAAQTADAPAEAAQPAADAELNDSAELDRISSLYRAGQYAECATQLNPLLGSGGRALRDPQVVELARVYHAACLLGSGQPERAAEPLKAALRANRLMDPPDALVFPPPVVQLFLWVKQSMIADLRAMEDAEAKKATARAAALEKLAKAEQARVRGLEKLAAEESVVIKNRRWVALVPFGVGQFQNQNTSLGWVFFATEALLTGTALTALTIQSHIQADLASVTARHESLTNAEWTEANARLQGWQTALEISSYGLLGVAALGILEAQLSFEPEVRQTRKRELPKQLRPSKKTALQPSLGVSPDGFALGVHGIF
jgi:hypothetical protein